MAAMGRVPKMVSMDTTLQWQLAIVHLVDGPRVEYGLRPFLSTTNFRRGAAKTVSLAI